MPAWLLPIFKSLLGGLFSFITREKARAEKERLEGIKAQRESIRKAGVAEQRIGAAMRSGVKLENADDWNATVEEWGW